MPISAFTTGFAVCATLIVAIGAQNAFVLRQGLRREHVLLIVAFCALADLFLISAGVAGVSSVLGEAPRLTLLLTATGTVFDRQSVGGVDLQSQRVSYTCHAHILVVVVSPLGHQGHWGHLRRSWAATPPSF